MPFRYDMIFQLTTAPAQATKAIAHTGSWSESHWRDNALDQTNQVLNRLLRARAGMLPKQAAMVGLRVGNFTIQGNRLLPGQTSLRKFTKPGPATYNCDVPQMALELSGSTSGLNNSKFAARGMPDDQVLNGEYNPVNGWDGQLNEYMQALSGDGWQMLGRVLSNPTFKIVSISISGVCTLSILVPFANGAQIRLLRCKDVNGSPVAGVYNASQVAGSTFLLDGWPAGVAVQNSGAARVDAIDLYTFVDVEVSRVVVRKVGRPFAGYRGKRSKRRARVA